MKILCYADLHVRESGEFRLWNKVSSSGLTHEAHRVIKTAEFIRDTILSERPEMVVNLGDFFNPVNTISQVVVYVAGLCMTIIKSGVEYVNAKHYGILGNHDVYSTESGIHSMKGYSSKNFEVFEDFHQISFDNLNIGFCPYKDKNYLMEMDYQRSLSCDLIFAHYTFGGAIYNSSFTEEIGFDPKSTNKKTVICGHIHIPQQIGSFVHYVGSTSQWKFREKEIPKYPRGVLIYDTEKQTIRRIKNDRVKSMAIISSIEELVHYDPEKFAIKYVGPDVDEKIFEKYEHDIIIFNNRENVQITYINKHLIDPKNILQGYVAQNYPDLTSLLSKVEEKIVT